MIKVTNKYESHHFYICCIQLQQLGWTKRLLSVNVQHWEKSRTNHFIIIALYTFISSSGRYQQLQSRPGHFVPDLIIYFSLIEKQAASFQPDCSLSIRPAERCAYSRSGTLLILVSFFFLFFFKLRATELISSAQVSWRNAENKQKKKDERAPKMEFHEVLLSDSCIYTQRAFLNIHLCMQQAIKSPLTMETHHVCLSAR